MASLSAAFGGAHPATTRPAALRGLLAGGGEAIVLPGVADALSARLVEAAGFPACYLSGAGVANSQLGVPDVGLVALTEIAEQARRVADAVRIPVIVDADTGYGGHLSVMRTVHLLEAGGVAGSSWRTRRCPSDAAISTASTSCRVRRWSPGY